MKTMKKFGTLIIAIAVMMSLLISTLAVAAKNDFQVTKGTTKELTAERTENCKVFELPDGSLRYDIYPTDVHYYDDEAKTFFDIDNHLIDANDAMKQDGYIFKNSANSWDVYFGNNASVKMLSGNYELEWIPECTDNLVAQKTSDVNFDKAIEDLVITKESSVAYTNSQNEPNYIYQVTNSGVKESIILFEPSKGNYSYTVHSSGLYLKTENDIIALYDKATDEQIFFIDKPYAIDSSGAVCNEVKLSFQNIDDNTFTLNMTVAPEFLNNPNTVYPVIVDPTVTVSGTAKTYDTYVSSANPSTNYYSQNWLRTGQDSPYGIRRTYINFDLPAALEANTDIDVTSASLKMYLYSSAGTLQTQVAKAAGSWSSSSVTWNNAPGYTGTLINASVSGTCHTMNVTSIVEAWVENSEAQYGFVVRNSNESSTSVWGTFYSSDYGSNVPVLSITVATTSGMNAYSVYGGNYSDSDAWLFSDNIAMCGFPVDTYVYSDSSPSRLVNAAGRDMLYWSSHGLYTPTAQLSYGASGEGGTVSYMDVATQLSTGSGSSFNSTVAWNNQLKWVILAACNQMKDTGGNPRLTWARAMLGSTGPVRVISGYIGTGPSSGDEDIVNAFFDNADTYCIAASWVRANVDTGFGGNNPGSLYHNTAWLEWLPGMDAAPSIDTINTSISPDIDFYYYDGSYITTSGPLSKALGSSAAKGIRLDNGTVAILKTDTNMYEDSYPLITASDFSKDYIEDYFIGTDYMKTETDSYTEYKNGEEKIRFMKNGDVAYYNGCLIPDKSLSLNYSSCEETAVAFLKTYDLPETAVYSTTGAFLLSDVALDGTTKVNKPVVQSYAFEYAQQVNGLPVSTQYGGNSILVSVGPDGVDHAHMKWNTFTNGEMKTITKLSQETLNRISDILVEKSCIDKGAKIDVNAKLVYSNVFSDYGKEYVPTWEVAVNDEYTLFVNATTGEISYNW